MLLHHAGREDVHQHLALVDRLLAVGIAAAEAPSVVRLPLRPQLHHGHVVPAEAGACVGAERRLHQVREEMVSDRLHVAVVDALHVGREREVFTRGDREPGGPGRGDVEGTLLGEEALVLLEARHREARLVARADREHRQELPEIADPRAEAGRAVVVAVAQASGVARLRREAGEPAGLEGLIREDGRDAERVTAEGLRVGRREESLLQVDSGLAGIEGRAGVVGVHPAVAEEREAESGFRSDGHARGGRGNREVFRVAGDRAGGQAHRAGRARRGADHRVLAVGREEGEAEVDPRVEQCEPGRIRRRCEG